MELIKYDPQKLIDFNKLSNQIDIYIESKNIRALGTIVAALDVWKKQYAGSQEQKNKAWKYILKAKQGMGFVYQNLDSERGENAVPGLEKFQTRSSDNPTTVKQQAEKESGKDKSTLNEYIKYQDIPDEIIEEYVDRCDENEKDCTDFGLIKLFNRIKPEEKPDGIIEETEKFFETDEYKIYNDKFENIDIPDGIIDIIITDPPYGIKYLEDWIVLAKYAKRVLKPHGFLISYFGEINLPTFLNTLKEQLDYYWMFALIHTGAKQLIFPRNILCGWKPIVIFQNGYKLKQDQVTDIIMGTGREKELHEWAQSEEELEYLISNFTQQGDVILDPFMGSATTILKAIKMNRKGIGIESDIEHFRIAKQRLSEL